MNKSHPIIQTVLDAHFPGVAKPVVMDEDDRWAFAIAELRAELTRLRSENAALRERADVRAIVGELREIDRHFEEDIGWDDARRLLLDLLRRLDESK